jgi:Flp pilus assembly protein TadD
MEGNLKQAVAYGEKAWDLRKDNPSIAANLAIAYHCVGNSEKRDSFYEVARKLGYHNLAAIRDLIDGEASIR